MILGVLKEDSNERRVAVTPDTIAAIQKLGIEKIIVEQGAGVSASYSDQDYKDKGAETASRSDVLKNANLLACIKGISHDEIKSLADGQMILGQFNPLTDRSILEPLNANKVTAFSLDMLPRTTRAQAMDVLSSMSTASGYKAVLAAANHLPSFFPMFMTAAGTIKPAKVLIIGAGVAGLQAIATARRLGAVVHAFDVRTAAKEEVLSLGAKFVDVEGAAESAAAGGYAIEQSEDYKKRQAEAVHNHSKTADVVICTAQIPGRSAPRIIHKATVDEMKKGAVIVDLAASSGGNCEVTENGKIIDYNGVTIIGDSNLPSSLPKDASFMFSKNIVNFLKLLIKDNAVNLNMEDDIITATCITHGGEINSARLKK